MSCQCSATNIRLGIFTGAGYMVDTRLRNKIFRKYKANGYAGVEAIFERDQRNQKFIWGMYDRICGMFCRKTR